MAGRSFEKGDKRFKLRYAHIDICKDARGGIKHVELGDAPDLPGAFVHTCKLGVVVVLERG